MILGFLLHTVRFQEPTFLPEAWLERQGYRRVSVSRREGQIDVDYSNAYTRSDLSIWISLFDQRRARSFSMEEEIERGESAPLTRLQKGAPSRTPLGTDVRFLAPTPYKDLVMKFRSEWSYGTILASWVDAKGKPTVMPDSAPTFAEALARQILARVEARRLTLPARRTLGETTVSTDGTPEVDLVDLSDWAKARGWALKTDDTMATLTKEERKLRVPLGALAVEVDGAWKELPEVVMLKDGKWWVPLDALEAATKRD